MTRRLNLATPAQRAAHRQRVAERKAREQSEHDAIVRRVLESPSEVTEQEFDVLVIPTGFAATSALPAERIHEYAEHLRKIIIKVDDDPDAATARTNQKMRERVEQTEARIAAEPTLRVISNRMCGMCKGGCCAAGGNAAYITSATIKREKKRQPGLSDEDLVQAYLSRLSSQTITDACINQATTGCVLPTEMRSDACNGFYCDTLSAWHDRPSEERADTIFAIQRSGSYRDRNDPTQSRQIVDVALVKAEALVPLTVNLKPLPKNS